MRAIAVGVFALLVGCDGCFAPKPACYPKTCGDFHKNCDTLADDGCGQPLDCGHCPDGQTCGVVLANVCDATPDSGTGWMGGGAPMGGGAAAGGGAGGAGAGGGVGGAGQGGGVGGAGGGPAPPILVLAGVSPVQVNLTWSVTAPVGGFAMDRAIDSGPFQQIGLDPGPSNHFSDFGVVPGSLLSYRVVPLDSMLNRGTPSNTVSLTVPLALSAWRTEGCDIQHSSANLFESSRPPGTLAWERIFDGGTVSGVAIDPPNAFVVLVTAVESSLVSLAADGGTRWVQPLGPVGNVSHPSVFDGKVSVNYAHFMQGEVDVFDENGTPLWNATTPAVSGGPKPAPISTGDTLIANGAAGGFVIAVDETTGAPRSGAQLTPPDRWAPTLSGGQLWFQDGPTVSVADLLTLGRGSGFPAGAPIPTISDEWVVASGGLTVVAAGQAIVSNNWMQPGPKPYVAPPAVASGQMVPAALFAANDDQIEMRAPMTGNLVATFATDGGLSYPPAYAAGVVYASSPTTVFAFDVQSQQLLWTTSPGGRLSIAQGTLYVAGGSTVRAYTLTP